MGVSCCCIFVLFVASSKRNKSSNSNNGNRSSSLFLLARVCMRFVWNLGVLRFDVVVYTYTIYTLVAMQRITAAVLFPFIHCFFHIIIVVGAWLHFSLFKKYKKVAFYFWTTIAERRKAESGVDNSRCPKRSPVVMVEANSERKE